MKEDWNMALNLTSLKLNLCSKSLSLSLANDFYIIVSLHNAINFFIIHWEKNAVDSIKVYIISLYYITGCH